MYVDLSIHLFINIYLCVCVSVCSNEFQQPIEQNVNK